MRPDPAPDNAPTEFGPYERTWNQRDCVIYALGVGAGTAEPALSTDNTRAHPQRMLPTFLINQGLGGKGFRQEWIGDPHKTVHAGHRLVVHSAAPVRGAVTTRGRVVESVTKKTGRLVSVEWEANDAVSGMRVCTNLVSFFVRDGTHDAPSEPTRYIIGAPLPELAPDVTITELTLPTQALLYRCSGDPNEIHTDPSVAISAGFRGPILHGLCTLGFATRAVLNAVCDGATERIRSVECRFSAPGYPGDALSTSMWIGTDSVAFRTANQEGAVLIDRGLITLNGPV